MKFILFVIDDQSNSGSSSEMQAIDTFNEKLQSLGYWLMAAGINKHESATLFDNRSGAGIISSGALFQGKEHYSGFWIIDVPDEEIAKTLAAEGSLACNRRVELRPFLR
jgi:hypothetical protein